MTFPGWGGSFGTPLGAGRGTAATPGRILGGLRRGPSYPSPFFDIAHTYLPTTVKELFKYCRYYFMTSPLINATVFKLSEYPITDIIIDHKDDAVKRRWEEYFHDHLMYRSYQVECGLDYHCYGNAASSLSFPFHKYLICKRCRFTERADKIRRHWVHTNLEFRLTCPSCGNIEDAEVKEVYYRNPTGVRLVRWNVEDIEITYNDITGESTYFYRIPRQVRSDIVIGKKDVVESVPQIFIQAIKEGKGIVFSRDNFFHLKRPTLACQDRGWGTPLVLPVLKDAFYLQLMKKAQEAILLEHIVPLRTLFPQAGSGTSDPYATVNLVNWKEQVAEEIARWRHDHNYMPIMPLPIGNQTIGGDGRALLLFQEMQMHGEQLIMGMGVPREFLQGGLTYSGTNVSLRMLENAFIGYVLRHQLQANWVMKMLAYFLEWPEANIRFKPFKMADDIQRKAYLLQLNQASKVSDTTLLADADLNQHDENEIMVKETKQRLEATKAQQLAMAEIQGQSQLVMMKYQARAQQGMMLEQTAPPAPGEPGGAEGPVDPAAAAQMGGVQVGSAPPQGEELQMPSAPQASQIAPGVAGLGGPLTGLAQESQSQLGMQDRMGEGEMGVDLIHLARGYASQIMQMPPQHQAMAVQNLEAQSPELGRLVQQFMGLLSSQGGGQGGGIDARPLPEKLPARRDLPSV